MPDVDIPRTWTLKHQTWFWSATGPAAAIAGQYRIPVFGGEIQWNNAQARKYWGGVVGDPEFDYPSDTRQLPTSYGDTQTYPPPILDGRPTGTPRGDHSPRFCGHCGAPNDGTPYCPICGSRVAAH